MMRKSFSGNARKAAVAVTFDDDPGTLTIEGDDLSGWPVGANGPFMATIARATSFEEKVLCLNRVGNQLNLVSRGYDSTVARQHASGQDLEHTWDSIEADLLNRLANLLSTTGSLF